MREPEAYKIGDWIFVVDRNALQSGDGEDIRIEDRAARVLQTLCRQPGQLVTKEELVARVWNGRTVSAHSLAVVISNLRRALGDDARAPRHIETVSKRGYRLIEATLLPSASGRPAARSGNAAQAAGFQLVNSRRPIVGMAAGLLVLLIAAGAYFVAAPTDSGVPPPTIITLNNVTNATGDPAFDRIATAFSEIGAAKLADARQHILIRDRWDFDARDPSLGLFDDFDEDSAVYHITGKIVLEDQSPAIAMFANEPKTGAIVWSDSFTFVETNFSTRLRQSLDDFLATIESPQKKPAQGLHGEPGYDASR